MCSKIYDILKCNSQIIILPDKCLIHETQCNNKILEFY